MPKKVAFPTVDELPAGPARDFATALYRLYSDAGNPALRQIAESIVGDGELDIVHAERIRQILRGDADGARWGRIEAIIVALVARVRPARDLDLEVARLRALWRKAFDPEAVDDSTAATGDDAADLLDILPPSPLSANPPGPAHPGTDPGITAVPPELRTALATLPPDRLVPLYVLTLSESGEEEARNLLAAIGRLRNPYDMIKIVENLRKRRLHPEATLMLQEAVSSRSTHDIIELILLFMKEDWRLDVLLEAIAAIRSAEDIVAIIYSAYLPEDDVTELLRKFTELRDPDEAEELRKALQRD